MKIKALVDTIGKKEPIDSSVTQLAKITFPKGKTYRIDSFQHVENNHIQVTMSWGCGDWYFYSPHIEILYGEKLLVDRTQLGKIFIIGKDRDLDTYLHPINKAMIEFNITNKSRICMFLAQIAHETGCLRWKEELASGQAYEGRIDLGNNRPGDGKRYKGRGLMQLTGRANYRSVGKALGVPLEEFPEKALEPDISARIAGYYWFSRNLNFYADKGTEEGFRAVTYRINGGYNGYEDRVKYWKRALGVI